MSAEREAPGEDSIRVVCRFRPLNDAEERAGSKFVVKFPPGTDDQCINLGVRNRTTVLTFSFNPNNIECFFHVQGKVYMFDKVFKPNASQEKVYNEAAKSIVKGISF